MKNALLTLGTLILLFSTSLVAQNYTPDFSIGIDDFEKEALAPKEEVWVVDFWASWCRPCIESIPEMKNLYKKYQDRGVRFISVSWDRNQVKWQYALDQFKMPWNHFIVPQGQEYWLEKNFPHKGIPTVFVINRDGKAKKVNGVYKLDKAIYKAL